MKTELDCTFNTELGRFNYRVGAIIADGGRVLMARNPNENREYYYSVGGRVKFGESMTDAVLREIREGTWIQNRSWAGWGISGMDRSHGM